MRIDIITLFPEMFAPLEHSIIKRARQAGTVEIHLHQLRDYATDRHRMVDDVPYGGGAGMVLKPDPIFGALRAVQAMADPPARVVHLSPVGAPFHQAKAEELSRLPRLLLLCGHYEGMDQRVIDALVDEEISLGDFVLTGGELAAMAVVDATVRLVPGVIDSESLQHESFTDGLLEFPHYTRPRHFEGMDVPEVLLSGHHAEITRWRRRQSLRITLERRPELLERCALDKADLKELQRLRDEQAEAPPPPPPSPGVVDRLTGMV